LINGGLLDDTATNSNSDVYVAAVTNGFNNIDELSSDLSTTIRTISIQYPYYLSIDSHDNLWVYRGLYGGGGYVDEYAPNGTRKKDIAAPGNGGPNFCAALESGVAADGSGNIYLNCVNGGPSPTVFEWNGTSWVSLFSSPVNSFGSIAVTPSGTKMYFGDYSTSLDCSVAVWTYSSSSWSETGHSPHFGNRQCSVDFVHLDSAGVVYATNYTNPGGAFEWDPTSGSTSLPKVTPPYTYGLGGGASAY
jgi:hypothetical protein